MADYCTLSEVKALLGATETTSDALLAVLISRATAQIEAHCRRKFVERTETRYYQAGIDTQYDVLYLDDDLLSVTTLTNGDSAIIPAAGFGLFPLNSTPKNRIRLTDSYSWAGDEDDVISVAGSWGYCTAATRPADITQAACRLALWLFKQRDAPFGRAGNSITGEYEVPLALPVDVTAILKPYRKIGLGWG